jgi:S-formylglutathione hydrolase FrmB
MNRSLRNNILRALFLAVGLCLATLSSIAQAPAGKLDDLHIDIPSLKGNLLGDPTDQHVQVYLPPSYSTSTAKRYPVLYLLHGYGGDVENWTTKAYQGMNLVSDMDALIKSGVTPEMIVVVPNGVNSYFGSFYTNSSVNGNWEDYIYKDVVGYVDGHYRTIARAASRGIAGHSMGGYGAIMLAMKHPDVFGAVYALSPCCVGLVGDASDDNPNWAKSAKVTSRDIFKKEPQSVEDFWVDVLIAFSAAFSPNPNRQPLMVNFPYKEVNGRLLPNEPFYSEFRAKMPLYLVDQYRENLLKLRGIAIDVGEIDNFSHIRIGTHLFSEALSSRGIPHSFEIYKDGDHGNKIRERFEKYVIPFMARSLLTTDN